MKKIFASAALAFFLANAFCITKKIPVNFYWKSGTGRISFTKKENLELKIEKNDGIEIKIFTQNWNKKNITEKEKRNFSFFYTDISESNIFVVHDKDLKIREGKQYGYYVSLKSEKVRGEWKELTREGSLGMRILFKTIKFGTEKGIGILASNLGVDEKTAIETIYKIANFLVEDKRKKEILSELEKNYRLTELKIYPPASLKRETARRILLDTNKNIENENIAFLFNITLKKGYFDNEEIGKLKNFYVELPKAEEAKKAEEEIKIDKEKIEEWIRKNYEIASTAGREYSIFIEKANIDNDREKEIIVGFTKVEGEGLLSKWLPQIVVFNKNLRKEAEIVPRLWMWEHLGRVIFPDGKEVKIESGSLYDMKIVDLGEDGIKEIIAKGWHRSNILALIYYKNGLKQIAVSAYQDAYKILEGIYYGYKKTLTRTEMEILEEDALYKD